MPRPLFAHEITAKYNIPPRRAKALAKFGYNELRLDVIAADFHRHMQRLANPDPKRKVKNLARLGYVSRVPGRWKLP